MCALILLFRNLQYSARGGEKITKTKLNNTSKQRNNQICDRNSEEWTKSISWTCLPTASVAEGQPECLFQSVCQAARHAVWKHPQSQNLNTFTCKSFVLSQGKGEGKGKEYSLWTMNLLYVPGSEISKSTAMCSLLLWCCQYMSESFQHIFHTSQFSFSHFRTGIVAWLLRRADYQTGGFCVASKLLSVVHQLHGYTCYGLKHAALETRKGHLSK